MAGDVQIQLTEQGADDERIQQLTGFLWEELAGLDGVEPHLARDGEIPEGARAIEAVAVGAVVVKLFESGAVRAVVGTIRSWLGRGAGAPRSVRLEIDGDAIEVSGVSSEQQESLVEMFIRRHSPRDDEPWPATDEP
jgi:hypothetical protein